VIGLVSADLAGQPFRKLELDDARDKPIYLFRKVFGGLLAGRRSD